MDTTAHPRPRSAGLLRQWAAGLSAAVLAWAGVASAQPVRTEHVTAELVAHNTGVQPGQAVQIGLRLQHIPHWHTYWRNPGDSGLPTTLTWTLPAGAQAGAIDWPAPRRIPIGPLVNYGYEGDLLLPLRFTAPADAQPGSTLQLKAEANWLVCNDVCIPESATLNLSLPVLAPGAAAAPGPLVAQFDAAAAEAAVPLTGWRAELQRAGRDLQLRLVRQQPLAAGDALPAVQVFPYPEQLLEPARHAAWRTADGYVVQMALSPHAAQVPTSLQGIVVAQADARSAGGAPWGVPQRSVEFSAPITEVAALELPAGAVRLDDPLAGGTSTPAGGQRNLLGDPAAPAAAGGAGAAGASLGLLAALAMALVGGMVLNLMPCVFPVLSIKLLGLTQQGDAQPARLRSHALAYSAGVVLSFLALAGLLLALRAAGGAVGWGFQLQEPGVVFVLALLFFALGLNLMGAFELGNLLPQGLAGWRAQRPAVDAFGSGVLAVLAASPCTAPFMGAALGYALTQSAPQALAVFGMLGLGMALPYAALVLLPGWRHRLPRPGPWMLRLKQALAFPMFATVVWLVWVLGLQAGIDGAAQALLALLGLAALVWLLGLLRQPGAAARLGVLAGVAAMAALLAWSWPTTEPSPAATGTAGAAALAPGSTAATSTADWQPYSDAAAAAQLAQGRTVFVDFTAAWCVSCQVNKRLVLTQPDVLADFDKAQVVRMRADWTRRDDEITAALARLGRNGVPVYALLRPGQEPLLLPEILTAGLVRSALSGL